ncbi:hypothetical protein ACFP51_25010 [Streptomyces pratens]|uniref:Uncharacterized protein n=1 Tax=Streptomyces pratens TaxID=887456 RepID=A0ABW1LYB7_9ACTN
MTLQAGSPSLRRGIATRASSVPPGPKKCESPTVSRICRRLCAARGTGSLCEAGEQVELPERERDIVAVEADPAGAPVDLRRAEPL